MNARHRAQFSQPMVTTALTLVRFLLDKSSQSRRLVLKRHSQWLYFVLKGGHFVCRVKKAYIPRVKRENDMTNLIEQAYVFSKTYQRRHRSR